MVPRGAWCASAGDTDTRLPLPVAHAARSRVESLAKPTRWRIEVPIVRRFSLAFIAAALMAMVAVPAGAAKPDAGCGSAASQWEVVTLQDWLDATEDAGMDIPEADEPAFLAGLAAAWDKNDDGLVCMKPFQPTQTPAFDPWFFNAKDNTSAAG